MPKPRSGEKREAWLERCIPVRISEGDEQDQAVAVCASMYKEVEVEEKMADELAYAPFGGATSFAELAEAEEAREAAYKAQDLTWQFSDLLNNIMRSDIEDKSAAIRSLTDEFLGLLENLPKSKSLWQHVKEIFKKERPMGGEESIEDKESLTETDMAPQEKAIHPFTVWKDDETEEYRWLAVYSNKWRDEDNPPEILASAAHQEFVEAVDKGDWPHPEAWLWHVPGTRFGVADFVAYDDLGFALASGTVDKGQEHIAEFLSKQEDLAMSHGMPVKEIERDEEDSTIITRYRSIEISPLPREAAANKHGTAIELIREVKMAIPDNKRAFLADAMGEKGLEGLDARLADKAKELEGLEIQSKEESQEEESVEPEVSEEAEEESPKEVSEETPEPQYVTATDVAEAVGESLKPIMEALSQLPTIVEAVEEQGKSIKALQKDTEERVKETIANTPAASLFEQIQSAIGSPETYIDGRTTLAKAGPKETEDDQDGPTHVGILNEMMSRSWDQRQ